jgi:hypothetical protein
MGGEMRESAGQLSHTDSAGTQTTCFYMQAHRATAPRTAALTPHTADQHRTDPRQRHTSCGSAQRAQHSAGSIPRPPWPASRRASTWAGWWCSAPPPRCSPRSVSCDSLLPASLRRPVLDVALGPVSSCRLCVESSLRLTLHAFAMSRCSRRSASAPRAVIVPATIGACITVVVQLLTCVLCISCAAVYELQAPGRDGYDKAFHKPWACTTMMFVGAPFRPCLSDPCHWDPNPLHLGLGHRCCVDNLRAADCMRLAADCSACCGGQIYAGICCTETALHCL